MKHILFSLALFISILSFGQDNGSVNGILLDAESNNAPLKFAKVLIKETGAQVSTNENGEFNFQNLNEGTYTLVISFVGYENKEVVTNIIAGTSTSISLTLHASSISLEDIMMTLASADSSTAITQ